MTISEFQLERYFARWEFTAPYLLSASDCETMSIGQLLHLAGEPLSALSALRLGYTESQGGPALREVIAGFYTNIGARNIVVTNAPEEGIFLTMMALLHPGDRVVVQTPCYQSLFELARFRGCQVYPWPMVETAEVPCFRKGEAGWQMDLDHLYRLVTPDTRLVVVNAPHNPTGYLPTADQQRAILDIVARQGAWLFSDEMYRGLEYDAAQRLPSASDLYPHAVSLWGMSKTFGLAGLRIGWLATQDRQVVQSLMRLKDYTTICSSAPGEFLARVALQHADKIISRNVDIIVSNLERSRTFMERWSDVFEWHAPLAGPIAFVRLRRDEASQFCQAAVKRAGVLLVPSTLFDFGDQHIRWGMGRQDFADGMTTLNTYLASLTPLAF